MRRKAATKRKILPDPKNHNYVIASFINRVMRNGKKSVAEGIVYGALDIMAQKRQGNSVELFEEALQNIMPTAEVMSRRVGGATYQVPTPVKQERGIALAMRWVIEAAEKRSEHGMSLRLANELLDALDKRGAAMKKREDTIRMAEANKAFAHYLWVRG